MQIQKTFGLEIQNNNNEEFKHRKLGKYQVLSLYVNIIREIY